VGTAVDLIWLAGLGWEYLDKQREQAELVYGYPDSSILTVNWALLTGYSTVEPRYKLVRYKKKFEIRPDVDHPLTK